MAKIYKFKIMSFGGGHDTDILDAEVKSLAEIEERFAELIAEGRVAAALLPEGNQKQKRSFDPNVENYVFHRQLQGG